jgi:hypothetical protein
MDMRPLPGARIVFKQAANEHFITHKDMTADRANPVPFPIDAVITAFYMHKAVIPTVKGWKGHGFNHFAFVKFGTADRTGMGVSRKTYASGHDGLAPLGVVSKRSLAVCPKKQSITEP